jgi:hypothetical protein
MIVWYLLLLVAVGLATVNTVPELAGAAFGCVVGTLIVLATDRVRR